MIYTTRTEDLVEALVESQGAQYQLIGLEALGVDDAAQLLLDGAGSRASQAQDTDTGDEARESVKLLGCLPLAVDSAASFQKQINKTLDETMIYQPSSFQFIQQ